MPAHAHADPPELGEITTRAQALAAGLTPGQIDRRLRSGAWIPLRPGIVLIPGRGPSPGSPWEAQRLRHRQHAVAAALRHPTAVIAGASAALVRDLPLVSGVPDLVELVAAPGQWTGIRNGVALRQARLDPHDLEHLPIDVALHRAADQQTPDPVSPDPVRDVPVTSVARTCVDIARRGDLADSLSVADRAVRHGLTSHEEMSAVLERMTGLRGCRVAAAALAHVDGRRENPLESLSFARMVEWDLPLPEVQVEFRDEQGLIGRVDFYWPALGIVGEADGVVKYTSAEALYLEKRRQERLEQLGLRVVRWGWRDLIDIGSPLRSRLWRLLRVAA